MNESAPFMYDLFLCYSDADSTWVENVLLRELNVTRERVITRATFRLGAPWVAEFERAVTCSRFTLLILSPTFLADQWSALGEQLASFLTIAEQQIRVIPLVKEPCDIPLRISYCVGLDCTTLENQARDLARLRDLLNRPEPEQVSMACPYLGMVPFQVKHAPWFFGRDQEIQELVRRVRHQNYFFVIGPSGSGNSSLVFAGLIPELLKHQPHEWLCAKMRPGDHPLDARVLAVSDESFLTTFANLDIDALMSADSSAQHLLLIIDQFEELFTQADKAERSGFIAALKRLRAHPRCVLVMTMRADYYADLMNSDLWVVEPAERLEIAPLRGARLASAIVMPARQVHVYLEPQLIERLVADAADEPGVLPLIQEVLVELWRKQSNGMIALSAYEKLGRGNQSGLAVTLGTHADGVYLRELDDKQRAIARRIFLRLIQFGEGRADTRRQQPLAALRAAGEVAVRFDETIRSLTAHRLLALTAGEKNSQVMADISHEALITGWQTLAQLVKERRETEELRRRLQDRAQDWIRLGRGTGGLLDATQVREAMAWQRRAEAQEVESSDEVVALIAASRQAMNPGWHPRGSMILLGGIVALILLIGLLYFFLESSGLPPAAYITTYLTLFLALGLGVVTLVFLRRGQPFWLQRFSHVLGQNSLALGGASVLLTLAVAGWLVWGTGWLNVESRCSQRGFEHGNWTTVAVITSSVESAYAIQFRDTLNVASKNYVRAWTGDAAQFAGCENYFRYRIELRRTEIPDGRVGYLATVEDLRQLTSDQSSSVTGKDGCDLMVRLAYGMVKPLDTRIIYNEYEEEPIDLAMPSRCEPYAPYDEGLRLYSTGRYSQAIDKFKQAIALEPNFAAAHMHLGECYYRTGNYEGAVKELEQANTYTDPQHPQWLVLAHLAIAYYRDGKYALAEQTGLAALEIKRPNLIAYNILAQVYRDWDGRFAQSAENLDRLDDYLRQLDAASGWGQVIWSQIGAALGLATPQPSTLSQDWIDAYRYYAKKNRGILAFKTGEWKQAIQYLTEADRMDPKYYEEEVVYYWARAYAEQGNASQACGYLNRYSIIQPSDPFGVDERRQKANSLRVELCH